MSVARAVSILNVTCPGLTQNDSADIQVKWFSPLVSQLTVDMGGDLLRVLGKISLKPKVLKFHLSHCGCQPRKTLWELRDLRVAQFLSDI